LQVQKSCEKAWGKILMESKGLPSEEELKKGRLKFAERIHFNKKFREKAQKDFTKLQEVCISDLESFNKVRTLKDLNYKATLDKMLDMTGRFLKTLDKLEKESAQKEIADGRFSLYKKNSGPELILRSHFFKTVVHKNVIVYLCLPKGVSKKIKKEGSIIRKRISLTGYEKIDSGKMDYERKGFKDITYICKGKKVYKINLTPRGEIEGDFWVILK
jgi:hypothetical protein